MLLCRVGGLVLGASGMCFVRGGIASEQKNSHAIFAEARIDFALRADLARQPLALGLRTQDWAGAQAALPESASRKAYQLALELLVAV